MRPCSSSVTIHRQSLAWTFTLNESLDTKSNEPVLSLTPGERMIYPIDTYQPNRRRDSSRTGRHTHTPVTICCEQYCFRGSAVSYLRFRNMDVSKLLQWFWFLLPAQGDNVPRLPAGTSERVTRGDLNQNWKDRERERFVSSERWQFT